MATAAVAAFALAAYAAIFLPYLPTAEGGAGSDYGYFMPQLLAGFYWYQNNGAFSVPWFTPAFCAGIPFYPNIQGMYFSLPQFLTFAAGPVLALQASFLAFAAAGFAGFHILLRKAFGADRWVALAGGVLFLFNGFYVYRFLIGHLTFHAFMLAPLVAVCALAGARPGGGRRVLDAWVLAAGLMIAYMVQSGMVHALPPTLIGIAAIMLVHAMLFGPRWEPFARLGLACGLALSLGAAKLASAFAYLNQFPRDMLPLIGFDSIGAVVVIALRSLFIAPAWDLGGITVRNNLWYGDLSIRLADHEFEYGVTFIPALLIALGLFYLLTRAGSRRERRPPTPLRIALPLAIGALLVLPIPLNWAQPAWTEWLESLPYFGNSMTMIRWFSMYVLFTVLIAALVVDRIPIKAAHRTFASLLIVAIVIGFNAKTDRDYYRGRADYKVATVDAAYAAAAGAGGALAVERLEWPYISNEGRMTRRDRNDSLTRGASQAECYEPIFGHRLEKFPYGAMREGPMLEARDGRLNVKNPACFVYPEANNCRPGDHFTVDQIGAARDFLAYRGFPFAVPWWQRAANWLSLAVLLLVLAGLAASLARAAVRAGRERRKRPAGIRPTAGSRAAR